MPTTYRATDASAYEHMMGRWSRKLAPQLIAFAKLGTPQDILDVGCGTGNLAMALATQFANANVTGVDASPSFVSAAQARGQDERLRFEQGDAMALPYADSSFDATLSLLVLNFVPDPDQATREMVRVTRPGGVVAASVWDYSGGFAIMRMLADTAAVLDVSGEEFRAKQMSARFTGAEELATQWRRLGLNEVSQTSLFIRMEFENFSDYWNPWLGGQGAIGAYVTYLPREKRARLEQYLRLAYLGGRPDGRRSFTAAAWAVRGEQPN